MNVPDETVRSGRNRRKPVGGKGVTLRDTFPIEWADLTARPDRSTKMAYALAGVIIGAILIRVFVLLRTAGDVAEGEQMSARLEQITA